MNDDAGNEILKPVQNRELELFLSSRVVRRYLEKVLRITLNLASALFNSYLQFSGDKFAGLNTLNALHSCLTEFKNVKDQYRYVSGKFLTLHLLKNAIKMRVLSEYDPEGS